MHEYAAGLFDGEGNVRVELDKRPSHKRPDHKLIATISNTNKDVLDLMSNEYGGFVFASKPKRDYHRIPYQWKLTTRSAYLFLKEIEPFVIIKKDQVRIALEFYDKRHLECGCGRPVPDEEYARREEVRSKLKCGGLCRVGS